MPTHPAPSRRALRLAPLLLLAACRPTAPADAPASAASSAPDTLAVPAAPGSRAPMLSAGDGRLVLSWLEPADSNRTSLRYSLLDGDAWSVPQTVVTDAALLVNGADVPAVVPVAGGFAAHWLVKGPAEGYSLRVSRSADTGATWTSPEAPHRDGTATEHGFARWLDAPGAPLGLVWLDGRGYATAAAATGRADGPAPITLVHGGHPHGHAATNETALRFTTLAADGTPGEEVVLDARTCDCCPTAAALTAEGPLVAYRDRSADETRDIAVVRRVNGAWTSPRLVHADGWKIDGCPVNGPSVAAEGRTVALAWFTGAGERPHVRLAFSQDAGATFSAPVELADASPLGHVAVALTPGGAAIAWLDGPATGATLRLRHVSADGTAAAPATIASGLDGRRAGNPVLARQGEALVLAWTTSDAAGVYGLRTLRLPLAP